MSILQILGDIHAGGGLSLGKAGIGLTLNSRVADQFHILEFILEQAIDLCVSDLVITGDIFDEVRPPLSLITLFMEWLKKCGTHNINVHLILGNHDILRSGNSYSSSLDIINEAEFSNVFLYKNTTSISIGTTSITFLPFRDRKSLCSTSNAEALSLLKESLVYELALMPETHKKVLIGHLAIEGSIPVGNEIDDIANELFCPLDMFNGYDYVFMGHIHKPQVLQKKNPHIAHIGSMDISNFGETDHKKYMIIMDTESDEDFKKIYLPTRSLRKICISVPESTIETTDFVVSHIKNLKEDLKGSIVKVEISLESSDLKSINKSYIEKVLLERDVFSVAGILENKKTVLIKKDKEKGEELSTKMDVQLAINKYCDLYIEQEFKSDFIDLATEIYTSYKQELK